jgi:hypothetical protein
MFTEPQPTDRKDVLSALAALRGPLAASTSDGAVCDAEAPLAQRLEAVRARAASQDSSGSSCWSSWGN